MSTKFYTSCIKIRGIPIIPPLVTPKVREECLEYKRKAIELEKKQERSRVFQQCLEDLERLQTTDLTTIPKHKTLENQLTFVEDNSVHYSSSPVPYDTYKKLQNLTSETIDVSEYSDEGVKVMSNEEKNTPPKLIRSNSYTLDSPSPILLAHLEKEARKCIEMEESESQSLSPVTVIDSEREPPLQVIETDVSVQQVTVTTVEPQLKELLDKLPQEHARNILEILNKQQEEQKSVSEKFTTSDKSMSVSISSQSLYYSVLSSDTTPPHASPINVVNLRNVKNMDENKAASVIGAAVRGYLVRRLIRTEKVQGLIDTIKDALLCAIQLHNADVIEPADVELHRRLIQQVSAACYAFHDIFFTLSIKEQMGVITMDRQRKIEKAKRPLSATNSNLSISRRQSARMVR
ncbi:centriolar coiled-coil protein of 110 kDa [Tribolium madens]|uniref:centriolar coiled-coil protein of 110 kDa n=1 Tax=Tribolium madens TaxID=41895 RepID=UPI001CF72690|nr:centriolar coiled-coil protein of 110 kDa [Tribolium madens]